MSQNLRELLITEAGYMNLITVDDMEDDFKELDSAYKLYISTGKVNRKVTRDDDDKEEKEEGKDDKEKDKDKDSDDDDKSGNIIVRAFKWIWNKITGFIKWIGGLFKKFWNWITGKKEDIEDKCKAIKENGGDASDIESTNKAVTDALNQLGNSGELDVNLEEATKDGILAMMTNGLAKLISFFTGNSVKEQKVFYSTTQKVIHMVDARADDILRELGIVKDERGAWAKLEGKFRNRESRKKLQKYINNIHAEVCNKINKEDQKAVSNHDEVKMEIAGLVSKYESSEEFKKWVEEGKHITDSNRKESENLIMEKIKRSKLVEDLAKALADRDVKSNLSAEDKAELEREARKEEEEQGDNKANIKEGKKTRENISKAYDNAFQEIMGLATLHALTKTDIDLDNAVETTKDLDGNIKTKIKDDVFKNFSSYSQRIIQDTVSILIIKKKVYNAFFKRVYGDILNAHKAKREWCKDNEEFRNKYAGEIKAIYDAHGGANRNVSLEKEALVRVYKANSRDFVRSTDDKAVPIIIMRKLESETEEREERNRETGDNEKKVNVKKLEFANKGTIGFLNVKPIAKDKERTGTDLLWTKEEFELTR